MTNRFKLMFIITTTVLLGLSALTFGLTVFTQFIIASIQQDNSLLGVIDPSLFDNALIGSSPDFLSLVIGLPVTILLSLIALFLAFLSFRISKRDHTRAAHETIRDKSDVVVGHFSGLAIAINSITLRGEEVTHELSRLSSELDEDAARIGVLADIIDNAFEGEDEMGAPATIEEVKKRKKIACDDFSKTKRAIKDLLLEYDRFSRTSLYDSLIKIYHDPVGRKIIEEAGNLKINNRSFDPMHLVQKFYWSSNPLLDEKKFDVNKVLRRIRMIDYEPSAKAPQDPGIMPKDLVKTDSEDDVGLALLGSILPTIKILREPTDEDWAQDAEKENRNAPEDCQLSPSQYQQSLLGTGLKFQAQDEYILGPFLISWIGKLFVGDQDLIYRVGEYFDKEIFGDAFRKSSNIVAPNKMILESTKTQIDRIGRDAHKQEDKYIERCPIIQVQD